MPALGQDSRQFYKKPETTGELWRYMNHEIELGHFKLAAEYLKGFVAKNPSEEELLKIQETEGNSAFARLLAIPELQADAKPLVDRVSDVLQKHLSDPGRLNRLIKNLGEGPEEREYSEAQLRRSGSAAVPALMQALLDTTNDPAQHSAILSAVSNLGKNAMPPVYAALNAPDATLRSELIETFRRKGDTDAVPHLWYFSAASGQPESIRKQAAETLAALRGVTPSLLPPAKVALVQEADKYYQHQVPLADPSGVRVWHWEGKKLIRDVLTASQAEEYYGLLAARQALEIDPSYRPAQIAFLSIALDKAFEHGGLDQPLSKSSPDVKDLLSSVSSELLIAVLNRALAEHRLSVILAATRGLGDLAEVRAAKQSPGGSPPVILRAMFYPDQRVQIAAADASLRIPVTASPTASARVVEILRRTIGGDELRKVLVADMNEDRANAVAAAVKKAGFEPVVVRTGKEVLRRLTRASDVEAVLIDADTPDPQLRYLLAELRADVNAGLLPIIITVAPDRVERLQRLAAPYRNVWVMAATTDSEALKATFSQRIAEAMGKPLSDAERRDYAALAMEWLVRIARGELQGYDVRPAEAAILQAIQNKELANRAIEAAGRLPGRQAQHALASVALDPNQPAALRSEAAVELTRHIQQNGLVLTSKEIKGFEDNFAAAKDPKLKANLALVVGSTHPDAIRTGERLRQFAPTFTPPPIEKGPKPKPGEKKEDTGAADSEE
jgi:CheY-like chemotaxis protein